MVHLHRLHQTYGEQIEFLFVHISDAYHHLFSDQRIYSKESDRAKRAKRVREGMKQFHLPFPCLLDREDRQVENLYRAFPDRLLLIDVGGRIAGDYCPDSATSVPWDEVDHWMEEQSQAKDG